VIGPRGNVIDIKEVSDPVGEGLDESAIRTVSTWKFEPPTRDGTPVAIHTDIEVSFRIF
jgi:TonB family protein